MNDPRPNGRSMFDARHMVSPVGRMRGSGYKEMRDDRGVSAATASSTVCVCTQHCVRVSERVCESKSERERQPACARVRLWSAHSSLRESPTLEPLCQDCA